MSRDEFPDSVFAPVSLRSSEICIYASNSELAYLLPAREVIPGVTRRKSSKVVKPENRKSVKLFLFAYFRSNLFSAKIRK